YESRDLYGAVWLEPHSTLRSLATAGTKTITKAIVDARSWPPMLTAYDRDGAGVKAAAAWHRTFKQDGKMGGEKALAQPRGGFVFERTLLAAEGADGAITSYLGDLKKERPLKEWAKRDVEASAYSWDLGNNRTTPAKAAKVTKPTLAPLNNWGFA